MPSPVIASFRGPFVVVAIGGSMAIVGMVPVVITMSLKMNSSATIIGVGFIGFGLLIVLPGLCWCIVIQLHNCRSWHRSLVQQMSSSAAASASAANAAGQDETSSLEVIQTGNSNSYGGTCAMQSQDVARKAISLTPQHSRDLQLSSIAIEGPLITDGDPN